MLSNVKPIINDDFSCSSQLLISIQARFYYVGF